ncbi:hypothetical protein H9P43_006901 [Blastocladiella emersonii ATCC 22665]|nr:hypothetical protein H9P43_006901 [Blastocladiella emersonii ATCC 22665]
MALDASQLQGTVAATATASAVPHSVISGVVVLRSLESLLATDVVMHAVTELLCGFADLIAIDLTPVLCRRHSLDEYKVLWAAVSNEEALSHPLAIIASPSRAIAKAQRNMVLLACVADHLPAALGTAASTAVAAGTDRLHVMVAFDRLNRPEWTRCIDWFARAMSCPRIRDLGSGTDNVPKRLLCRLHAALKAHPLDPFLPSLASPAALRTHPPLRPFVFDAQVCHLVSRAAATMAVADPGYRGHLRLHFHRARDRPREWESVLIRLPGWDEFKRKHAAALDTVARRERSARERERRV